MALAGRVTQARERKGWSQRELATRLGARHTTVNEIERGKRKWVRSDMLAKLARELGVSTDWLLELYDVKAANAA